jgi:hypothetical protein
MSVVFHLPVYSLEKTKDHLRVNSISLPNAVNMSRELTDTICRHQSPCQDTHPTSCKGTYAFSPHLLIINWPPTPTEPFLLRFTGFLPFVHVQSKRNLHRIIHLYCGLRFKISIIVLKLVCSVRHCGFVVVKPRDSVSWQELRRPLIT